MAKPWSISDSGHRRGPAARRAPFAPGRPRDGPTSAEAKPRRGVGRRREPAHVRGDAAGAVTAPVRRGAVGPAEARRSHKPAAGTPASASRSTARSAAGLLSRPALSACIAELNGGARPRARAHDPRLSRRSRTLQERRRDVGRASVPAERARHGGLVCRSQRARPRPGARGAHHARRPCAARERTRACAPEPQ